MRRKLLTLCAILVMILGSAASELRAQTTTKDDAFTKHQRELSAQNPGDLVFTLKLTDSQKQFHVGEKIRLQLAFSSSVPDKYVLDNAGYDRSGRLDIDSFALDRRDDVTDPLFDYYHKNLGPFMMGGLRGNPSLGSKPEIIDYDLNEWLRFEKPGKYRLYVISHRVSIGKPFRSGSKPVEPASNLVEFEIVPADREWEQATLASARKTLDAVPAVNYSVKESERRSACRTLRFLGTDSAIKEMVARFRGPDRECEFEYYIGLIGAPNRKYAIEQMELALNSPAQPISSSFLSSLIFLAYIQQNPEPWPEFGRDEAGQKAARAQWEIRRANYDLVVRGYVTRLANAITEKQGTAAATSLETLINYRRNDTDASSRQQLAVSLAKVFLDLPAESQRSLLEYNWKPIADPAMLPALRQLYQHPPDLNQIPQPFPGVALQRIYELSPVEGRQLILDEIKRPVPRVGVSVLGSLPDKELPELEDEIVQHLIDFNGEYRTQETAAALIARYVSPASLTRVREAFENRIGKFGCTVQSSLIEYFLRSDQDFGLQMVRKAVAARKGTRCYVTALENTVVSGRQLTPEAERLLLEYLNESDAEVVYSAVRVLSIHGSSDNRARIKAAIKQVVERLRAEKRNPESDMSRDNSVEVGNFAESLLRSYLTAVPWWVEEDEVKELADLCLTEQCRTGIKSWSPAHQTTITIYRPPGLRQETKFSVGPYELLSWDNLKRKLIQFPKGTKFIWQLHGQEEDQERKLFDELQTYLKEHGLEVARPASN